MEGEGEVVYMSTLKTPPEEGWREISPKEVEKVWRSSWEYYQGTCQYGR